MLNKKEKAIGKEEQSIKVTIMIPTYNQDVFIREAIDSALSQTYQNLEVIVGDDHSTDATQLIVEKINDPRLKYVRNTCNLGRVANYKNLLYSHATGDYVVNLDGDDFYTSISFIDEAVNCIIRNNIEVVMVVARATRKSSFNEIDSKIHTFKELTGIQILSKLPQKEYLLMHMAVLYSRKHAIQMDFYRFDLISSDWESLYRLALRGMVCYIDINVGVWRIHGKNESRTIDVVKHLDNLNIWKSIYIESVYFGMNSISAHFFCARCVAYFAQSSCSIISQNGNKALFKFIYIFLKKYKLSSLMLLLSPIYCLRLLLCIFGYYRRKRFS